MSHISLWLNDDSLLILLSKPFIGFPIGCERNIFSSE